MPLLSAVRKLPDEPIEIDGEFRDALRPLSAVEFGILRQRILADGRIRDPIILWQDGPKLVLVDGMHRWKIYLDHEGELPPVQCRVLMVDSREEVLEWIRLSQEGRRNPLQINPITPTAKLAPQRLPNHPQIIEVFNLDSRTQFRVNETPRTLQNFKSRQTVERCNPLLQLRTQYRPRLRIRNTTHYAPPFTKTAQTGLKQKCRATASDLLNPSLHAVDDPAAGVPAD